MLYQVQTVFAIGAYPPRPLGLCASICLILNTRPPGRIISCSPARTLTPSPVSSSPGSNALANTLFPSRPAGTSLPVYSNSPSIPLLVSLFIWRLLSYSPRFWSGFPILAVFRLKGKPKREGSIIVTFSQTYVPWRLGARLLQILGPAALVLAGPCPYLPRGRAPGLLGLVVPGHGTPSGCEPLGVVGQHSGRTPTCPRPGAPLGPPLCCKGYGHAAPWGVGADGAVNAGGRRGCLEAGELLGLEPRTRAGPIGGPHAV